MKQWQEEIFKVYTEGRRSKSDMPPVERKTREALERVMGGEVHGLGLSAEDRVKLSSKTYAVRELLMSVLLALDIITDKDYEDFEISIRRGYDDGSGGGKGWGGKVAGTLMANILRDKNDEIESRMDEIEDYLRMDTVFHIQRKITNSPSIAKSTFAASIASATKGANNQQQRDIKNSISNTLAQMGADTDIADNLADYATDTYMSIELAVLDSLEDTQDLTVISIETDGDNVQGLLNVIKGLGVEENNINISIDRYSNKTVIDFTVPVGSRAESQLGGGEDFESISEDPKEFEAHMSNIENQLKMVTKGQTALMILPPSGYKETIQSSRMEIEKSLSRAKRANSRNIEVEPENTDEDPEYGSKLPDAPEIQEIGDEDLRDEDLRGDSSRRPYSDDDDEYGGESFSRRRLGYGDEDLDDGELSEYEKKRSRAIERSKRGEENNEEHKMSPQQINQWMYMQRASRMQNNLRQNERWGNY